MQSKRALVTERADKTKTERQQMKKQRIYQTLITLSLVGLLTACGGGGGGSDAPAAASSTGSGTVSTGGSDGDTVTGGVTKGPVSGATVLFYAVDQFGFPLAAEIASATTNAAGNFTVTLPADTGTVLVESFGGSYVDESDQGGNRVVQLGPNDGFSSILPTGSSSVAINPITDSLVLRSRILSSSTGGFGGNFVTTRAAFSGETGFDAFTTVPSNPTSPAAGASEAEKQYALMLGGLANAINNITVELGLGAPTYEVIRAVTADLVDGELDGLQFGSPVAVQGANGVVNLTTDIDFDLEVNRFRNNNAAVYEGTPAPVFDFSFFANSGPIANAGADQTVARSTAVTLDGSGSNDPEGAVTYNWVQTSGPSVTLTGATTVSPTFTAPDTLIGDEVIVLTLTVADAVNTTATDTVTVNIKGALPTTFVIVDQDEYGDNVGEDVDGGGQITLNPDGTGELFVDEGKVLLNYTITGDTFRVTFPNGFIADDFDDLVDDGMGNFVPVIVEEHPDFIEFTLTADLPNKDVLTAVEQGQEISENPALRPNGPYSLTFTVFALDKAQQVPFVIVQGSERMLPMNIFPSFPQSFFEDELAVDIFVFNADGTGITEETAITFDWTIEADGHLSVTMSNGESADYFNMGRSNNGDIISAAYQLTAPLFPGEDTLIHVVRLSFEKVAATVPTTQAGLAGIYTGTFAYDFADPLDGDLDYIDDLSTRLNPDGTGSFEGYFFNGASQQIEYWAVPGGFCWQVDGDGDVQIDQVDRPNRFYFPATPGIRGSVEPTVSDCLSITEIDIFNRYIQTVFRVDGNVFSDFQNRLRHRPTPSDPLTTIELGMTVTTTRVPLTITPPYAGSEYEFFSVNVPLLVDVLFNDFSRDGPAIDPTTVVIVSGPYKGTATVDPSTGEITYTSDALGSQDSIQYRVFDTAGNPSTVGHLDLLDSGG